MISNGFVIQTSQDIARDGCGAAVSGLAVPALRSDCDVPWIEPHQLVNVNESMIPSWTIDIGDLFSISVDSVTGDCRTGGNRLPRY